MAKKFNEPETAADPAPQADAPQADAPQADAPQADAPQADAPNGDVVGKALSEAERARIRDLKSKARALTEAMKGFAFLTGETLPNEALTGVEIAVARAITVIETEAVKRFLDRTQGQTAAA